MCVCIYTSKLNLFVMVFYALNSIANISNSPFCGCFFGFGIYMYIHKHTSYIFVYAYTYLHIFFAYWGLCNLFLSVSLISCV